MVIPSSRTRDKAELGHAELVDRRRRAAASIAALVVMAGGTSACADWPPPEFVSGPGSEHDLDDSFGDGDYRGKVIASGGLHIRQSPTTRSPVVGGLRNGSTVWIDCKVNGQTIKSNPRWYRLAKGRWVAARYVTNVGAAPRWCH